MEEAVTKKLKQVATVVLILFIVFLVLDRADLITSMVGAVKQFGQWLGSIWHGFWGFLRSLIS